MLYDVPVEPLIAARPEAKGSLLGLLSLAFLAHHQETCAQVRRIMESGTGAMVTHQHERRQKFFVRTPVVE
jgi:hypothetical protein